jgi:hypothetical protein
MGLIDKMDQIIFFRWGLPDDDETPPFFFFAAALGPLALLRALRVCVCITLSGWYGIISSVIVVVRVGNGVREKLVCVTPRGEKRGDTFLPFFCLLCS